LSFELRHLRYVIAAVEHGSFRKAATALGIQESSVSRRIRELEDEIGAALFNRSHSGVCPTYAGLQFIIRARKAIDQITLATRDVAAIGKGEEGVVRIGLFPSLASGFLAELVQAYERSHARVRLEYYEGGAGDLVPAVRQRRLDVAFLTGLPRADECDVAHLWNEQIYVAMAESDVLAAKAELRFEDLRGRAFVVSEAQPGPEISNYLVKHLVDFGISPDIDRQAVYRDTLMRIVAGGRKLTLTNEATTATQFPGVVYRPLGGEVLPFSAVWSPRNDNPAFRRFLSLAMRTSKLANGSSSGRETHPPAGELRNFDFGSGRRGERLTERARQRSAPT